MDEIEIPTGETDLSLSLDLGKLKDDKRKERRGKKKQKSGVRLFAQWIDIRTLVNGRKGTQEKSQRTYITAPLKKRIPFTTN